MSIEVEYVFRGLVLLAGIAGFGYSIKRVTAVLEERLNNYFETIRQELERHSEQCSKLFGKTDTHAEKIAEIETCIRFMKEDIRDLQRGKG